MNDLYYDIEYLSKKYPEESVFNLFTEPIDTMDILDFFPDKKSLTTFGENRVVYDYKTKFNKNGYFRNKIEVLEKIKKFIDEFSNK